MGEIHLGFKGNLARSVQDMAGKCMQKNFMERSNYFFNGTCKAKFAHHPE